MVFSISLFCCFFQRCFRIFFDKFQNWFEKMEEKAAKGRLFQAMSYLGGELASSESARYRFIAAIHLGFDKR
jgi:hypothetical protein